MNYTKFDWNWPVGSVNDFFFNINICKYGFPHCGLIRSPWTMMWRILNLHCIRKLSHENVTYSSSINGFKWKRFLNDPNPFLHFCNYLPFEEDTLALYLNNLEFPFTQGWFISSLMEIGIPVHGFHIVAPPDLRGPWCEQFWICITS
jgi:hypothetical protein